MRKTGGDVKRRRSLGVADPLSDEACGLLVQKQREARDLDFKQSFDPSNSGAWCELIKDIVAMANSGGGYLIIGVDNNGTPVGHDLAAVAGLDQAVIVDKIGKYTDTVPAFVSLRAFVDQGQDRVILHVAGEEIPIVFSRPGTYALSEKKQTTAFSAGVLYFRHGSKSEPARQSDIQRVFDQMLRRRRREILSGVRKVVTAPSDHQVVVMPKDVRLTENLEAPAVRLTTDPKAPAMRGLPRQGEYESIREELGGVMRDLKTDAEAYAPETQLWRFYQHRRNLSDNPEHLRALLACSMHRHCPTYYWAYKLGASQCIQVCLEQAKVDRYPAVTVIVRIAFAVGGDDGRHLLEHVRRSSRYASARYLAERLLPLLGTRHRVWKECGARSIRLVSGSDRTSYPLSPTQPEKVEALIDLAFSDRRNRPAVKTLDALAYGVLLETQKG